MNAMRNRNVNEKVTKNVRVLKFILFKCLWVLCYFGLCICIQCEIRNGVLDLLILIYLRLQISVVGGGRIEFLDFEHLPQGHKCTCDVSVTLPIST